MGCCLTRHPGDTSGPSCWFVSNTVGHESTSTNVNGLKTEIYPQTSSTSSDARNTSAATSPQLKITSGESWERKSSQASEHIRQAFLDGTLHPDPRCPLDARQLYTLTKSWKTISRNLLVTAVNIFVR